MKQKFTEKPSQMVTSVGPQVIYITLNYNVTPSDDGEWEADSVQFKSEEVPSIAEIVDTIIGSGRLCSVQELEGVSNALVHTFNVHVDDDELFEASKKLLLALNSAYGSSEEVNVFLYEDKNCWIDKTTRTSILSRLDAEEEKGKRTTNLSIGQCHLFNIPIASARAMLKDLEIYAAECYDMTNSHQLSIVDLETYAAVYEYDYKADYPEPLVFTDEIFTYVQKEPTSKQVVAALKKLALPTVLEQDDDVALENIELFPSWESMLGKELKKDERYYYDDALWKVVQTHIAQSDWTPRVAFALFTQVVKSEGGDSEIGTLENPIPFSMNMELVEGLYYLDEGVIYLCIESLNQCFWHLAAIPRYAQAVE